MRDPGPPNPPPVPPPVPAAPPALPVGPTAAPLGLLSYRAVRYLWATGVAPRWIDVLLILATAVCAFVGLGGVALCWVAESPGPLSVALPALALMFGLFWWSNHFRHRRPVAADDPPPAPAMPVIPAGSADPGQQAGPGPMPVLPVEPLPGGPTPGGPMPVLPIAPAAAGPRGLLSYRAVRYLWQTGVAPQWADGLLLLLTGSLLFAGSMGLVIGLLEGAYWMLAVTMVCLPAVGLVWWWSNHFRHRRPTSIEDEALPGPAPTAAALPDRPMPVMPLRETE